MKIYVDLDHVDITEYTQIESGEYNTNKINFIFTPEYKDLIKVAIFGCKLDTDEPEFYKIYLSDDSCYLPQEVVTAPDVISIGVYAFNVEESNLILRYSPTPVKTIVYEGSFREEAVNSSSPTPTEIEQLMARVVDLEELTEDLETRVETLESKACNVDELNTKVATLETEMDSAEDRLDSIEGDLADTYSKTEVDTLLSAKVNTTTYTTEQAAQDEKIARAELILSQLPKVTGTGNNVSLSPTIEYDLEVDSLKGDTSQDTAILPSEYQQVEYIESTGTQYISTGIYGNGTWNLIIEGVGTPNATQIVLGRSAGTAHWFGISSDGYYTIGGDTGKSNVASTTKINTSVTFENTSVSYTLNDTTYTRATVDTTPVVNNYNLFAQETSFYSEIKLYEAKLTQNDVLVRDFIPCYRISDSVIGLYDLVNDVFYTNNGSGTFTKGSNVSIPNPSYPQDVEVVTGTQTVTISNSDDSESQTYTIHLGDIELAKIGDYQDKIYYNNGKWYKESAISKVTLDGTEGWSKSGTTSFDRFLIGRNIGGIVAQGGYCNYFKFVSIGVPENLYEISNNGNAQIVINFAEYGTTTVDQFKTWLGNHNTIFYYVLQTATTTEITDDGLLTDLNNIKENAMSYSGATNISTSGNLPIIITASALKQLS